jgi:hypothetical protein
LAAPVRAAIAVLILLTVAGCSSLQGVDVSRVKMSVDGGVGGDTYKNAKVGVGQPI